MGILSSSETQYRSVCRVNAPDVLIHLHIATTGGTSLSSMIKHGFRSGEVFESGAQGLGAPGAMRQAPREHCERQLVAFGLDGIRYISGHVPMGIHRVFQCSTKYI